ncbi:MAG: phosphohydrolase [Spirochaetales bacterium]|nr:phosphohydrolase [Spirochaetales bacterium]
MNLLFSLLASSHKTYLLQSFSALDYYFRTPLADDIHILTDALLVDLAGMFETLEFHGLPQYDVVIPFHEKKLLFQIVDSFDVVPPKYFPVQHLLYDFTGNIFYDKTGIYPELNKPILCDTAPASRSWHKTADEAVLVSRYHYVCLNRDASRPEASRMLSAIEQQHLLVSLMTSQKPQKGLTLLLDSGFIDTHWPELSAMNAVQQTKDYHPEGNVWEHVCEALNHRKQPNLLLSLAILLHDLGKTAASGSKNKPYENHSSSGSILARNFLQRLLFPAPFINDVMFLVQHHMMPEALPEMPFYRISSLLSSPLFPVLLELYRADLLATFQGPDKYYTACQVYKTYCKTQKNPYRELRKNKRIVL